MTITRRRKPRLFEQRKRLPPSEASTFPHPKPTFDVITYSAQMQQMLSRALDAKRTIRIEFGTDAIEATVVLGAIGSDGQGTFYLAVETFIFGGTASAPKRHEDGGPA